MLELLARVSKMSQELKFIIEALLFASQEPLSLDRIKSCFDDAPSTADINSALEQLADDYSNRAIELKKLASGYQIQTKSKFAHWIGLMWEEKPAKYSRALLETLAIIAYRQPVTRGEIEDIRGVAVSSSIMKTLLERGWVRIVGHRDVPGKPGIYATTKDFLDYFNLASLDELPSLLEIKSAEQFNLSIKDDSNALPPQQEEVEPIEECYEN